MDFYEALIASGSVIVVILLSTLLIYFARIREITADITPGTRRALYAYGGAGIGMMFASIVSIQPEGRFLTMGAGAVFLGFILYAEMWILYEGKKASRGGNAALLLMIVSLVSSFGAEYVYSSLSMLNMVAISILLVGTLTFTVVLLRENLTAFTGSLFAVLVLYLATWGLAATSWTFDNPEFYILQILPLVVAGSIYGSVRSSWRRTVALFIQLLNFSVLSPLIVVSFESGEPLIWGVLVVEMIAGLALIAPLDYFYEQATKSGSMTSRYLGLTVSAVALLVITHGLSWAYYISNGGIQNVSWNFYMIWVDATIGGIAVIAFILAPITALFGEWVYSTSREIMVVFATIISVLAFPLVQAGRYSNEPLWLAFGVVILIGFIMYSVLAYRLSKAGARRAAINMMVFVVAAVLIALATMYSDDLPLYMIVISLLIGAGLALVSSPPVMARLSKAFRRLEESEDIGVQEDGSIRWEEEEVVAAETGTAVIEEEGEPESEVGSTIEDEEDSETQDDSSRSW
ncbi:MAG: hypothetical protein ACW98Y_06615 [Candidatus Thorarchaeota archaeon]|jgi:hypothetical protein